MPYTWKGKAVLSSKQYSMQNKVADERKAEMKQNLFQKIDEGDVVHPTKTMMLTNLSVVGQQATQILNRASMSVSRDVKSSLGSKSRVTDKTHSYSQIMKMMRSIEEYGKNIELSP